MFIGINLGNTQEPKPVPSGRYRLTIAEAKFRTEKNDIQVSIGIDDHLDAPNISHFISLPKKDDDVQKVHFKQLMLKRFLAQFNIPYDEATGFNTEDLAGAQAEAQLTLTEPDEKNAIYNRLQLDKLS